MGYGYYFTWSHYGSCGSQPDCKIAGGVWEWGCCWGGVAVYSWPCIGMPFFNHEVVKKALVMAMEKKNDRIYVEFVAGVLQWRADYYCNWCFLMILVFLIILLPFKILNSVIDYEDLNGILNYIWRWIIHHHSPAKIYLDFKCLSKACLMPIMLISLLCFSIIFF